MPNEPWGIITSPGFKLTLQTRASNSLLQIEGEKSRFGSAIPDGVRVNGPARPSLNTSLNLSRMSVEEINRAGGARLFRMVTGSECIGNIGRNVLRADGIANVDLGIFKNTKFTERQRIQLRAEMYNATNTRNFGIPEARVNSANFLNQWGTDGGNRRILLGLRYTF